MSQPTPKIRFALLGLACVLLSSCAGRTPGEHIADMPHWMGGEPDGVPPRRGTPEYDAWMAARAEEAARPKNGQSNTSQANTKQPRAIQPKPDQSKPDQSMTGQAR